jgi:hypothetical protein
MEAGKFLRGNIEDFGQIAATGNLPGSMVSYALLLRRIWILVSANRTMAPLAKETVTEIGQPQKGLAFFLFVSLFVHLRIELPGWSEIRLLDECVLERRSSWAPLRR